MDEADTVGWARLTSDNLGTRNDPFLVMRSLYTQNHPDGKTAAELPTEIYAEVRSPRLSLHDN